MNKQKLSRAIINMLEAIDEVTEMVVEELNGNYLCIF